MRPLITAAPTFRAPRPETTALSKACTAGVSGAAVAALPVVVDDTTASTAGRETTALSKACTAGISGAAVAALPVVVDEQTARTVVLRSVCLMFMTASLRAGEREGRGIHVHVRFGFVVQGLLLLRRVGALGSGRFRHRHPDPLHLLVLAVVILGDLFGAAYLLLLVLPSQHPALGVADVEHLLL